MDFWYDIQIHKWGNVGWIVIFVICLFLLYKNHNKWGVEIKQIVLFVCMSILLYYCPFFARIMIEKFLPSYLEYERLSWLFFSVPIMAYTFVCAYSSVHRVQKKKILLSFVVICLLFGTTKFITRYFKVADNSYKIPDKSVMVADTIVSDSKCYSDDTLFGVRQVALDDKGKKVKPKVLVQLDEKIDYSLGNEFFHGIREYVSPPVLSPVIIPKTAYNSGSFKISNYAALLNYEYFVCTNSEYLRKEAEAYGFVLLAEAEDYVVYKNNNEVTIYYVRHGETEANANDVFAGSKTDTKLTNKGITDAKETGDVLSDIHFDTAYVSELTRTNDTAKYILEKNSNKKPNLSKTAKLNDINAGQLEGLSRAEVMARYPDFSEDKYYGTISDSKFVSPVGATSKYTVVNNYKSVLLNAVAGTPTGGNALIVGHGGFSWMLQTLFPDEISDSELPDNASITVIKYNKGKFELESYNTDASQFKEIEQ